MASIGIDRHGSRYIQFEDEYRHRRTMRLGKITKRNAEAVRLRIEKILAAKVTGSAIDAETSRWISEIGEKMREKFAKFGLIETQQSTTLAIFIDRYKDSRKDVKQSTVADWKPTFDSLIEHFGENKPLRSISVGDANNWRREIGVARGENTVRKYTKHAKTLFNSALEFKLVERNPFSGQSSTTLEVPERMYFITPQQSRLVLDACPSTKWKVIFALARWGGLRCPSEVLSLKWGDVLWDTERMTVRKHKTKHRVVPLFPELRPILEAAFDEAPDGTELVVGHSGNSNSNLRTTMTKIVERAGIEPWPRLFQNLRSTRETELVNRFPIHVVCKWIGNSQAVANKHYLQMTEEHFATATGKSAANALQNVAATEDIQK